MDVCGIPIAASDLTNEPDTNSKKDVFLFDLLTGIGSTKRVSISTDQIEADNSSGQVSISADGRFIAFYSYAGNLNRGVSVPGEHYDVFVHDRLNGTTDQVSLNSLDWNPNGHSYFPSISGDGRQIVFVSAATDLVAYDRK